MSENRIIQGDCLEVLKSFPENSIDALITDPPAGIAFMNKHWDGDKGGREHWIAWLAEIMREALRILKPGAHGLVWSIPRTSHWTGMALEDAGFEVRDCVYHCFGSGFPKSLNIGKKVDRILGNERDEYIDENFLKRNPQSNHKDDYKESSGNPSWKDGDQAAIRTKGHSEFEGFGTALKPAIECWWLIRKPLSEKNVALNCLKWGTGGLAIDECRIETNDNNGRNNPCNVDNSSVFKNDISGLRKPFISNGNNLGRFPANFIHDGSPEILKLFPSPHGAGYKTDGKHCKGGANSALFGSAKNDIDAMRFGDSGSAARFFYCAKASRSERNAGCDGLPDIENHGHYAQDEWSRNNMGNLPDSQRKPVKNNHPTVKPLALIEYFVKLISRKGQTLIDPFAGSGTTGLACKKLNRNYILIEKEAEYIPIIKSRLKYEETHEFFQSK
jgi:site-specific DNA-methyltransferase (adenine-specific)